MVGVLHCCNHPVVDGMMPDPEPYNIGVAVHGRSFTERNVSDNRARRFPKAISGLTNIGLLHTNASGARDGDAHERYAPCQVQDLLENTEHECEKSTTGSSQVQITPSTPFLIPDELALP